MNILGITVTSRHVIIQTRRYRERYAGLLLAPVEGFGRGFFFPLRKKRAVNAVCAYFKQFLVFSSSLRNVTLKRIQNIQKKSKNINKKN